MAIPSIKGPMAAKKCSSHRSFMSFGNDSRYLSISRAVVVSDSHPHCLRSLVGYARPTFVNNDLKIVRMLWEESSPEFWMHAPVHVVSTSQRRLGAPVGCGMKSRRDRAVA